MSEFAFIRHGHKLNAGEVRNALEESGLTAEQQDKWKQALAGLPEGTDPELTYENVPLVEKMAQDMYEKLPAKAQVLFTMTDTPRTRMTADLLSSEIIGLAAKEKTKDVGVAYVWEAPQERIKEGSVTRVAREAKGIVAKWKAMQEELAGADEALNDYFAQPMGGKTHPKELEIFRQLVNRDLASEDSVIRQRAESLKSEIEKIEQTYADPERPLYFFGVGHMSSLVALDVAFGGRQRYESVNEMPAPLSLWQAPGRNKE